MEQVQILQEKINVQRKEILQIADHVDYLQKLVKSLGGEDNYYQEDGRYDMFNAEQALNNYHKEQQEIVKLSQRNFDVFHY